MGLALSAAYLLCSASLPVQPQAPPAMRFAIVDTSGAEMIVTDLVLDYTNYPAVGFYTPVHVRTGVRIRQGEGELTMRWSDIVTLKLQPERIYFIWRDGKRLEFSDQAKYEEAKKGATYGSWGESYKHVGTVQLNSGATRPVELIPVTRPISGKSELGEYSVLLEKVREIRVLR
jgi:hypothetical protein